MAQCQALTKSGQPCKNEALPGSSFCRVHQRNEEGAVIIQVGPRKVRLQYMGQGQYLVAGYLFTKDQPVHEVPERLAEYLLDSEPELFTLVED